MVEPTKTEANSRRPRRMAREPEIEGTPSFKTETNLPDKTERRQLEMQTRKERVTHAPMKGWSNCWRAPLQRESNC